MLAALPRCCTNTGLFVRYLVSLVPMGSLASPRFSILCGRRYRALAATLTTEGEYFLCAGLNKPVVVADFAAISSNWLVRDEYGQKLVRVHRRDDDIPICIGFPVNVFVFFYSPKAIMLRCFHPRGA